MRKLIIVSLGLASITGCSISSPIIPKEEQLFMPENYSVKKTLTKNDLSDEEKQNRVKNWWSQFNNKELLKIIEEAQKNSPTISAAAVNIKKYENILLSNKARFTPNLNFDSSSSADYTSHNKLTSNISIGLKTSWELDLFGKNSLNINLNKKQIESANALWHEAQTIVAAEAARSYFSYHFCKKTLSILKEDYEARRKQNEITHLRVQAGFEAQTSFYQNEAGLSQSQSNILAQEAQCETEIKSMVALTAIPENELRLILSREIGEIDNLYVPVSIPGELLNQRPDVLNAINNLKISALDIAKAQLDYYPSVSISGNISNSLTNTIGLSTTDNYWSIGPISVYLPIFDMGMRKANDDLLIKKYEQSKVELSSSIRNAIKEVEIAMINLSSRNQRSILIDRSVENYKKAYEATTDTYRVGLSSLFDLEDTRRNYLNEVNGQLDNELEKLNAWINLYKAVGGGFKKIEKNDDR
jgi:multidrug efflux system outer membrane protein